MNNLRRFPRSGSLALAATLALAACGGVTAEAPPLQGATLGGPLNLVNQDGRRVGEADFAGKYRLVYFGFSYCPDVCPVDLAQIARGYRAFEASAPADAARVVPVFVSVDPARDAPALLKAYAAAFHPRLVALTGTESEIAAAARAYGVAYSRAPGSSADSYSMDHSRMAVLYGPDGAPIAIVPHDQGPAAITAELEKWIA